MKEQEIKVCRNKRERSQNHDFTVAKPILYSICDSKTETW